MFLQSFVLFILFISHSSEASQWALRARENYEVNHIDGVGDARTYSGLSSTVNVFYEDPYALSYGLGINLPISELSSDLYNPLLGDKIKPWSIGGDVKFYPWSGSMLFVRGTLGYQKIDFSGALDSAEGLTYFIGTGWEFLIFDTASIAPEVGYRRSELSHDVSIDTFLVSLGIHFYSFAKRTHAF